MSGRPHADETDDRGPELERLLGGARELDPSRLDVGAMWNELEARVEAAESRKSTWLKSRPTWARRAIAIAAALGLIAAVTLTSLRPDFATYPRDRMFLYIAALGYLLLSSLYLGLRPLHQPAPSRWSTIAHAATAIAVTFLLSAYPAPFGASNAPHEGAMPCFYFGVLLGVPVYALARALDRGAELSALLAACSAGLLGNVVLQLNCPSSTPSHLLASHFPVLIAFLAGLGIVRALTPHRRSADRSR